MITLRDSMDMANKEFLSLPFSSSPTELYEPIEYLLSLGGKRLRPALVFLSASFFGNISSDVKNGAIATELFHNATLMHDDIMDNSPVRRGKTTVHNKWGNNSAILSGDTMLLLSYCYLSMLTPPILPEALTLFNRTTIQVCEGQQYDMDFEKRTTVKESEYLQMIELKTAVLIAMSLQLGALINTADKKQQEALYRTGLYAGMAFQLQDDLLDVYGDPETFGKQTGGDIVENKKTFLLIKAFELSDDTTKKQLNDLLQDKSITAEKKIEKVKNIYDKMHIASLTRHKIDSYFSFALHETNQMNISAECKKELEAFIALLNKRNT